MRVLVTGATGYVGGRLVPALLDAGHEVRCFTRVADRLRDLPWRSHVEVAQGDVLDQRALLDAFRDVDVAYYLVHALGSGRDFEQSDREAARNFATAADDRGIGRVVYLGGLAPADVGLSPHLRSRQEVGEIFLGADTPAAVLRAAVILGSGSASFEMLRHLTERLPAMVTPRWVRNRIQPIALRDVVRYLSACATSLPGDVNRTFDIGGPDVLTYASMMQRYAELAGLHRRVIMPVPVLSPSLSSHWVGLVTPVPNAIARPLVESLRHEVVCREHDIARWVPDPTGGLVTFDDAIRLALATVGAPSDALPTDPEWAGGSVYVDKRVTEVAANSVDLWRVVEGIGGDNGWYSWKLAWWVRGWIDRLVGGVGLRRGRRDPSRLRTGDAVDFWRVDEIEPGHLLRLRAEMRLPGRAWLEFRVDAAGDRSTYTQRAVFAPRGLAGHVYWWSVAPFHHRVFGGMARNIAAAATRR